MSVELLMDLLRMLTAGVCVLLAIFIWMYPNKTHWLWYVLFGSAIFQAVFLIIIAIRFNTYTQLGIVVSWSIFTMVLVLFANHQIKQAQRTKERTGE